MCQDPRRIYIGANSKPVPPGMHDKYKHSGFYRGTWAEVPCRKCPECLKIRIFNIRQRIQAGYLYRKETHKALFVTFTVDDTAKVKNCVDTYRYQFRKFFEFLRYKTGHSLPHITVFELGDDKQRLHAHMLLFFDKENDGHMRLYDLIQATRLESHRLRSGWYSPFLFDIWKLGLVHFGDKVDITTCYYISSYISDKRGLDNALLPSWWSPGFGSANEILALSSDIEAAYDRFMEQLLERSAKLLEYFDPKAPLSTYFNYFEKVGSFKPVDMSFNVEYNWHESEAGRTFKFRLDVRHLTRTKYYDKTLFEYLGFVNRIIFEQCLDIGGRSNLVPSKKPLFRERPWLVHLVRFRNNGVFDDTDIFGRDILGKNALMVLSTAAYQQRKILPKVVDYGKKFIHL